MYGVLICSRCGTVQGVDLSHARVDCVRCWTKIKVSRAKLYFSTDSPQELAIAVRRLAERERGQETPFIISKGTAVRGGDVGNLEAIEATIAELEGEKGQLTYMDLSSALGLTGATLDMMICRLLAAGIIYETGPGTYRVV